MNTRQAIHPEFSRLLPLERIGARGLARTMAANAEERADLARRFDLLMLDRLEAQVQVKRQGAQVIVVHGTLQAAVTQACVVSLLPVKSSLEVEFQQLFSAAPDTARRQGAEVSIDLEEEDLAEAIGPQDLDLGEIVAQQLALNLEPYPRASDAELDGLRENLGVRRDSDPPPQGDSAFSVLRDLKGGN